MSVLELAGPVLDVHVKRPRQTDWWGVEERSAVSPNVVVVPVFRKPQTGEVSIK